MSERPLMTKAQWDELPRHLLPPKDGHAGMLWRLRTWDNCWALCEYVPDHRSTTLLRVEMFRVRVMTEGVFKGAAA